MPKKKYNCPAEMTLGLIGGKWKAVLLYNLRRQPRRFGELRRMTPGITQATLAQQLDELETSGIVRRKVISRDPLPAVEYSLTTKGESLKPVLSALIKWGLAHQKDHALGEFVMLENRVPALT